MIVFSIWDIVGIAFWVLIILAFIFVCIMTAIGRNKENKEKEKEDDTEIKREMCRKAIQSGVCPHTCDICAWNTTDAYAVVK